MSQPLFRYLEAEEIECRVQQLKESKRGDGKVFVILLLYKDARCDQRILDETVGPMRWQRKHSDHNGNLFCSIGIRDEETNEWIWKEDAGAKSNVDPEKGHASDSFKRAGTNWGIGRELYTAPFIYIELQDNEYYINKSGKPQMDFKARFSVKSIQTVDGKIKHLEIVDRYGKNRWKL